MQLAAVYNDTIAFLNDEGSAAVAAAPGSLRGFQGLDDGFLITYHPPNDSRLFVAKLWLDGSFSEGRPIEPMTLLASRGNRVLAVTELSEVVVLDGEGNLVGRAGKFQEFVSFRDAMAAASDENFLLVWSETEGVYARAVSFDGAFLSERNLIAAEAQSPDVASDGRRFLVTWLRFPRYEGRRVSSEGVPSSEPFTIADGGWPGQRTTLGWDGSKYIFLFDHPDADLHRVDITRSGVPGEPRLQAGRPGNLAEHSPHIASSAAGTVIGWTESLVCGVAATGYFTVNDGPPLLIARELPGRSLPVTAALGTGFATAWLEQTDALRARVRVGEEVFDLSTEYAIVRMPVIASAGDRVLVSWVEYDIDEGCQAIEERHFAVIDARSGIVRRGSFRVAAFHVAAASNGSEFVMIWSTSRRAGVDDLLEMHALRISRDGQILDPTPKVIASQIVGRRDPVLWNYLSMTWTGEEYLAVWQHGDYTNQLRMQRISRNLDPIESLRTLRGALPSIATSSVQTLVVFTPTRFNAEGEVRGLLLPSMQEIVIATGVAPQTLPLVTAWGSEFVVAAGPGVYRVTADGSVQELTTLPLDEPTIFGPARDVAIAANGSRVNLVYEKGSEVFVRTIGVTRRRSVR